MAEEVDARGREAGQAEIAPEAVIEGGAGDALGTGAGLPERLMRLHGREVLADVTKRSTYGRERGAGKFTTTAQTALADVAVEDGRVVEGDIAGGEVDDLGSASAGEDESEDDGQVASALDGVGDDLKKPLNLCSGEAAWGAGTGLGALDGIAGIGLEQIKSDEELEEGRDAGEAGADGYGGRFTAREADAVGEAEDVLRRDLIGRLLERAEEVSEGAVVGVWGAVGAGAALLLGEEGVERALPARVGTREDGRQSLSGRTWRTPWLGTSA